jgi:protein SCO1
MKRFIRYDLLSAAIVCALGLACCNKGTEAVPSSSASTLSSAPGDFPSNNHADSLPAMTLIDQYGRSVRLESLKGKPVLIDFIYTTCPGPCETMTAKIAQIARGLGTNLGTRLTIVSVTLDPEHDGPRQLLDFAKAQGADRKGWFFLTGKPAEIERLLSVYGLKRQRDSNGMIDHILEMFLLGPDGRQIRFYSATEVKAQTVIADMEGQLGRG